MNLVNQIKREISHTQTRNRNEGYNLPLSGENRLHGSIMEIYRGYGTNLTECITRNRDNESDSSESDREKEKNQKKKEKKECWVDFIIHSYPSTPVSRQKQNQNLTKLLIFSFCNRLPWKCSGLPMVWKLTDYCPQAMLLGFVPDWLVFPHFPVHDVLCVF